MKSYILDSVHAELRDLFFYMESSVIGWSLLGEAKTCARTLAIGAMRRFKNRLPGVAYGSPLLKMLKSSLRHMQNNLRPSYCTLLRVILATSLRLTIFQYADFGIPHSLPWLINSSLHSSPLHSRSMLPLSPKTSR